MIDAPTDRLQAIAQARDLASWDAPLPGEEARGRLEQIFTMLEPWARETIADRVQQTRNHMRKDEPLPRWTPEQWIAAINVQLGYAAMNLHTDAGYEDRETAIFNLLAVAGTAMDAIEALTRDRSAERTDGRH